MKLTIGKLLGSVMLIGMITNGIVYKMFYNEYIFSKGPLEHGMWTYITGISNVFVLIIVILVIIITIYEYWDKPLKR